jgi:hypothetical protein
MKSNFSFFLILLFLVSCGISKIEMPKEGPEEVVKKFYSFISQKGKGPSEEARKLISKQYGVISEDSFRRWTDQFDPETTIKIIDSKISDKKDKKGNIIAMVTIEFSTPSILGDPYKSRSLTNLILDKKEKRWKIDFTAETKDEEAFKREG